MQDTTNFPTREEQETAIRAYFVRTGAQLTVFGNPTVRVLHFARRFAMARVLVDGESYEVDIYRDKKTGEARVGDN